MHSEWTVLYETWTIVFKTVKLHIVLVFCGKTLYSFMWNLKRVFGIVVYAIVFRPDRFKVRVLGFDRVVRVIFLKKIKITSF